MPILEKPYVPQAQKFCVFHVLARNLQVFTRMTCKESCANSELYDGLVQVCHLLLANSSRTTKVIAFCCTCLGSLFLKSLNNNNRRMLSLLSVSFVEFGLPFSLKVCTTCEMMPLTVPSARHSWRSPKYSPHQQPWQRLPA
jgi:hypothetical protein